MPIVAVDVRGLRPRREMPPASAPAARHPFDLGADQPLDETRQIVVEPRLEHRLEHFAHEVFERAGVLHQHGLRERVEGEIDRRRRARRQQAVLAGRREEPARGPQRAVSPAPVAPIPWTPIAPIPIVSRRASAIRTSAAPVSEDQAASDPAGRRRFWQPRLWRTPIVQAWRAPPSRPRTGTARTAAVATARGKARSLPGSDGPIPLPAPVAAANFGGSRDARLRRVAIGFRRCGVAHRFDRAVAAQFTGPPRRFPLLEHIVGGDARHLRVIEPVHHLVPRCRLDGGGIGAVSAGAGSAGWWTKAAGGRLQR